MNTTSKSKLRDSNIELLRFIAMVFVVSVHINGRGLGYFGMKNHVPTFSFLEVFSLSFAESMFAIGVPVFILISGYYGIKLKVKSLVNLYGILWFYLILLMFIGLLCFAVPVTLTNIVKAFMPFISSSYWFITVYVCLMLMAPLLNNALKNMNRQQVLWSLGLLFLVNCYFGYFRGLDSISGGMGTNLISFLFIYVLGYTLHLFNHKFTYKSSVFCAFYLLVSLVNTALLLLLYYKTSFNHSKMIEYNNPLIIIEAVLFFLMFKNLNLPYLSLNKVIRILGASSLSIYLVHEHPVISSKIFPFGQLWITSFNDIPLWLAVAKLILLVLIIVCGSIIIDQVRIKIMTPICSFVSQYIEKSIQKRIQ